MKSLAKPEVCLDGDRIAVFLGSDYKHLDLAGARKLSSQLNRHMALLARKLKRQAREQKAGRSDG